MRIVVDSEGGLRLGMDTGVWNHPAIHLCTDLFRRFSSPSFFLPLPSKLHFYTPGLPLDVSHVSPAIAQL